MVLLGRVQTYLHLQVAELVLRDWVRRYLQSQVAELVLSRVQR